MEVQTPLPASCLSDVGKDKRHRPGTHTVVGRRLPIDPDAFLARAQRLQAWTAGHPIDLETLMRTKEAGRA